MMKLAITVMMLAAANTFGAVTLIVQETTPGSPFPDAAGKVSFSLYLSVGAERVNGFDVLLKVDDPAAVPATHITGRTLDTTVFDVSTKTLSQIGVDMVGNTAPNLGAGLSDPYGVVTGVDMVKIEDFVITVTDPSVLPVTLTLSNGGWFGPFNDDIGDVEAVGTIALVQFAITPEPASMLLVAAGAAFFARRRA